MLSSLLLALMVTGLGSPPDPIRLKVSPLQAFGPVSIRAVVTVVPDYLNTYLCLLWGSDDGAEGSSCQEVNGQYAPNTLYLTSPHLPPGHYGFLARLYHAQHWLTTPTLPVTILSRQ